MKLCKVISTLTLVLLVPLAGCDDTDPAQQKACEEFAKHLATVVQQEQGEEVPKEQVDKMVEGSVEKCLEAPPTADAMKCAMAATDTKTMKACDPEAEASDEKE